MAMTDHATILDKVRKCLRLSQSSNANEAALAAATAQRLIDDYELHTAVLALDADTLEPEEPIYDFGDRGAPLDADRPARWAGSLAAAIARANACIVYTSRGILGLIGRAQRGGVMATWDVILIHLLLTAGAAAGAT